MDATGNHYDDMTFDDMLDQLTREERLKLADERLKAGSGFDYRAAASKMLAARQTHAKTPEEIERITANDNWASHEEQERQRLEGVGRMETAKAVQGQAARQTMEAGQEFDEWDKSLQIGRRNLAAAKAGAGYFEAGGDIPIPELKAIGALKRAGGNEIDADYIEKVKDEFSEHYDDMFASEEFQNQDKDFQMKAMRHRADMIQALTDAQKGIRLTPEKLSLLEEAGHAYNRFMLGTVRGAAGVGKWLADAFSHSAALDQMPGVHGRTAKDDLQAASEKAGKLAEGAAKAAQTDPTAVESRAAQSETWNLNRAVSLGVSGTLSSMEAMAGTMLMGPAAGLAVTIGLPTFGSTYMDVDEDLRRKFPKMSANSRFVMATAEAGVNAAIEMGSEELSDLLGLGVIGGVGMKRPAEMFMGDVTKRGARRFLSGAARNMRNMAMGTFAEWLEEAVADPLEDLAKAYRGESEIAEALKGKDKGANLAAYAMNSWRDSLLGVATIPFQGAASAGIQAMQKRNNVSAALSDPETLKEFGVKSDYVADVTANAMRQAVLGDRAGAEGVMQTLEKMAEDSYEGKTAPEDGGTEARRHGNLSKDDVAAARKIFDQVANTVSLGSSELLQNLTANPLPYNGHARLDISPVGERGLQLVTASLDDEVVGMAVTPSREDALMLRELARSRWLGAESQDIKDIGDGRYATKIDGKWMIFNEHGHKLSETSKEQSEQMETALARQLNRLPREYRLDDKDGNVGIILGLDSMPNGRHVSVNEWGRTEDNRPQWMVRGSMEDLDWVRNNVKGVEFVPGENESVLVIAGENPRQAIHDAALSENQINLGGRRFSMMKGVIGDSFPWVVRASKDDLLWLAGQDMRMKWDGESETALLYNMDGPKAVRQAIDPSGEMQEEKLEIARASEPEWASKLPGYDHARLVEHLKNLPDNERSAALKFFGDGETVVFYPGEDGAMKAGTRQQCVEDSVDNGVAVRDNGKGGYEFVYRNGLTVPVNQAAYDYAMFLRGESPAPHEAAKPKDKPPRGEAKPKETKQEQAKPEKAAGKDPEEKETDPTNVSPTDVYGAAMDDIRERVNSGEATEDEKEELAELEQMAEESQADDNATISAKGRVVRLKTAAIKVDPKRFQFKSGTEADTGVERSNELTGDWDEKTAGNLYVWQDKAGNYYVVNGHHRLDLARRKGVEEVNAMVEREADGVTEEEAKRNGVLINIRDGQGTVEDYARFIHGHKMTEGQARAAGFIRGRSGGKGWQGYLIGAVGSEAIYSEFINGGISAEKAAAVINVANGDEGLEAAAIRLAPTMDADSLAEAVKALKAAPRSKSVQLDLFGFDDSAIRTAEAIGKIVARRKAALKREIASARGAVKRPDLAENMDVNVGDDAAGLLKQKAEELQRLEHYDTDHELYQELLKEATANLEKTKAKPKKDEAMQQPKEEVQKTEVQKTEFPKTEVQKTETTEQPQSEEPKQAQSNGDDGLTQEEIDSIPGTAEKKQKLVEYLNTLQGDDRKKAKAYLSYTGANGNIPRYQWLEGRVEDGYELKEDGKTIRKGSSTFSLWAYGRDYFKRLYNARKADQEGQKQEAALSEQANAYLESLPEADREKARNYLAFVEHGKAGYQTVEEFIKDGYRPVVRNGEDGLTYFAKGDESFAFPSALVAYGEWLASRSSGQPKQKETEERSIEEHMRVRREAMPKVEDMLGRIKSGEYESIEIKYKNDKGGDSTIIMSANAGRPVVRTPGGVEEPGWSPKFVLREAIVNGAEITSHPANAETPKEGKAEQPKQEKAEKTSEKTTERQPTSVIVGGVPIVNGYAQELQNQRERAELAGRIIADLDAGKTVVLSGRVYKTGVKPRYTEIKRTALGEYQARQYGDGIQPDNANQYVHNWSEKEIADALDGLLIGHDLLYTGDGHGALELIAGPRPQAEQQPQPEPTEQPAKSNTLFDEPLLTEEDIRNSGVGDENMILLAIDYINGEKDNAVNQSAYALVRQFIDGKKKENGQEFNPKTDTELRSIIESGGNSAAKRQALRKYASDNGITEKAAQERTEEVLVAMASEIAARDIPAQEKYYALLNLYQNQPVLDVRTSTSIANQAYSTPAPLAFAVGNRIDLANGSSIYEPATGNGMLVSGAPHGKVHVNEIDPARLAALHRQGDFLQVTDKDASQYVPGGPYDRETMNPPFGNISNPVFTEDGYKLSKLDHVIAYNALKALADDGKAGIIVGANTKNMGGKGNAVNADWVFMNWLYKNFNVKDNFIVDGDLYMRQGAGYPVRVITIDGRRETPAGDEDAPREVEKVDNWDDVWNKLNTPMEKTTPTKPEPKQAEPETAQPAAQPIEQQAARPAKKQPEKKQEPKQPEPMAGKKAEQSSLDDDIENVLNDIMGNLKEFSDASTKGLNMNMTGFNEGQIAAVTKLLYNGVKLGFLYIQKGLTKFSEWLDAMDAKLRKLFKEHGLTDDNIDEYYQDVWNSQYLHDGKRHTLAMWASELGQTHDVEAGEEAGDLNVRYVPASNAHPLDTVSPKYLAEAMAASLNRLQERVGNLDQFVMKELGYATLDELYDKLAGEQVDGVAMIIDAMRRGDGFILGDQTGIGKGRQCAAVMRWAMNHGRIPIFVTEKSNLFTDMYRDGIDVGTEFNPVIFSGSSEGNILNQNKEVVHYAMSSKKRSAAVAGLVNGGDEYNSVFMTYSQINKPNRQRDELMSLVGQRKCVLILDEAHNAAGSSQTGEFFLELLRTDDLPVLYASATFAKRPDNMVLYFRTSLRKAVDDIRTLPLAIRLGGVPLQQVVSRQLAEDGLFIRRERDFRGVEFENVCEEPANYDEVLANHDRVVKVLEHIVNFSNLVKEIIKARNDDSRANTREDQSIQFAPFASVVHNYINQLLLASKVDLIVERAIKAHEAGEKPVIALTSTNESAISSYMQENGIQTGERADIRYADILLAAVERMRRASRRNGRGMVQQMELDFDEMGVGNMYVALKADVESLRDISYPVSPIDYIRNKLEEAGIVTREITGRTGGIDYSGKVPTFRTRDAKDKGKNGNINDFNDGVTECLIINQSGATGMSIHASYKFKDQRVRRMIMAQPSLDINVVMQMFGRVMRSGQVVLPKYEILSTPLAAERRPHMILSKKMKSLNANTTANSKGAVDLGVDFMNEIGDGVANDMLLNDVSLAARIGITGVAIQRDDNGNEIGNTADMARRMSGKMAILSNAEQEHLYKELEQRYEDQVELMKAAGEYTLEAEEYDWQATPDPKQRDEEVAEGVRDGSVFERPVIVRHLITRDKRRIPSWEAVQNKLAKNFNGKPAETAIAEAIDNARKKLDSIPDTYERLREDGQMGVTEDKAFDEQRASGSVLDEVENFFYMNPVDSVYKMTFGEREYNAILTGFKISKVSERTMYRGSQIFLDFTVDSNVPRVRIPFSQFQNGKCTLERVLFRPQDIFTGQERTFRLPVTLLEGNMVNGFALAERGRIVNYTTEEGTKETGILMPKGWTAKDLAHDPRLDLPTVDAVMDYLWKATREKPANVVSTDNVVHIGAWVDGQGVPSMPGYQSYMSVQFVIATRYGRKFITDKSLTQLLGEFSGTRSQGATASNKFRLDNDNVRSAIAYFIGKGVRFRRVDDNSQDSARYLTGRDIENPMDASEARRTVNDLKGQYAIPIELIEDEDELPENLQRQLDIDRRRGVFDGGRTWKGIYSGNRVYVNAQAAESKQDVAITVLHEAGVHAGLRALFPNEADFNAFLDEMHDNYGVVKALARRHEQAGLSHRAAIEEAIADMADKYNKSPVWRRILLRVYDTIRNLLAKIGVPVTQLVAIRNIIHDAAMAARRNQDTVESPEGGASYRSGEEADRYEGQYVEVDGERIPFTESADVSNMSHEDIRKMVEDLLEKYKDNGKVYVIQSDGTVVGFARRFPSEYARSKYTRMIERKRDRLWKAKMKGADLVGGMIEIATNRGMEKKSDHHINNFVTYDTQFAIRMGTGEVALFSAKLNLIVEENGEHSLYDVIDINKKGTVPGNQASIVDNDSDGLLQQRRGVRPYGSTNNIDEESGTSSNDALYRTSTGNGGKKWGVIRGSVDVGDGETAEVTMDSNARRKLNYLRQLFKRYFYMGRSRGGIDPSINEAMFHATAEIAAQNEETAHLLKKWTDAAKTLSGEPWGIDVLNACFQLWNGEFDVSSLSDNIPHYDDSRVMALSELAVEMRESIDRKSHRTRNIARINPHVQAAIDANYGSYHFRAYRIHRDKSYTPSDKARIDAVSAVASELMGVVKATEDAINQGIDGEYRDLLNQLALSAYVRSGDPTVLEGKSKRIRAKARALRRLLERTMKSVNGSFKVIINNLGHVELQVNQEGISRTANGIVGRLIEKNSEPQFVAQGSAAWRIIQTSFLRRKDLPQWIRTLYGEITDIGMQFEMTARRLTSINVMDDMYRKLREFNEGLPMEDKHRSFYPSEYSRDGIEFVKPLKGAKFGALDGMYTDANTYNMLTGYESPTSWIGKAWRWLNMRFRYAVTVWNPSTHERNFLGNFVFAMNDGEFFRPAYTKHMSKAFMTLIGRGDEASLERQRLMRLGLIGSSAHGVEIFQTVEAMGLKPHDFEMSELLSRRGRIGRLFGLLTKKFPEAAYAMEDNLFRVAALYAKEARGESSEEAVERIRDLYTTYDMAPMAATILSRNIPTGKDFMTFTVESLRCYANAFKYAKKDLANGNFYSTIGMLGVHAIALPFVQTFIGWLFANGDEDDDEKRLSQDEFKAMRVLLPEYMKNHAILPWRKGKQIHYYDLGYIYPFDFLPAMFTIAQSNESMTVKAEDLMNDVVFKTFFGGMTARMAAGQILNRDPRTGRPFVGWMDRLKSIAAGATPSSWRYFAHSIQLAAAEEDQLVTPHGEVQTARSELAKAFIPIREYQKDIAISYLYKMRSQAMDVRSEKAKANQAWRRAEAHEGTRADAEATAREVQRRFDSDIRENIRLLDNAGAVFLTRQERGKLLRDAGFSMQDTLRILDDKPIQYIRSK